MSPTALSSKCQKKLPVLDIVLYRTDRPAFVRAVRDACHRVGFFLLKHGLPKALVERQLEETRAFFNRPKEMKMLISYENNPTFRGYMAVGSENTAGKTDLREQVEYAREAALPPASSSPLFPYYDRLRGSNPWPTSFQPSLQSISEQYVSHVSRLAHDLRKSLCLALGLSEDYLAPLFENEDDPCHWVLKLISYPPVPTIKIDTQRNNDDGGEGSLFGVGEHCDTNFLTMILQDDVGGLQVFSDGHWIDVSSDLGLEYLVINLGEQAEIFSKGYFRATPHRVLANTHTSKNRVSVPLFFNPALSAVMEPAKDLDEMVLPWDRTENRTHWKAKQNAMLTSVGENTFKSLARSHPKVFERHHGDLQLMGDGRIVPKGEMDSVDPII